MSVEIASLRIEVDATSAKAAKVAMDDLTKSGKELEGQAGRLSQSQRAAGAAHGYAGTAAANAEKSMRSLVGIYGNLRDELGRFTAVDGSFRHSQEATAAMALRNAQAQAALAREQAKAEAQVASLTKKYDALRAELDPFAAVQTTLARRVDLLNEAMAKGVITADQHAAMLSKVTRVALDGAKGVDVYTTGLRNGGHHLTNFSFQLNDIVTGLLSGQKPMQVLAQQGGQVFQIFQVAAVEAGGFKAAIKGLTAEVLPLIATFGPWIAGLTAVGAAVFYVVDQQNKQAKAIEDTTTRLEEQRKSLVQISPLLSQAKIDADLAAEGQKNFDDWLRKANVSLADQIRLQRIKTLNDTNDAALKAGEELRKAQEQFDKLNKPGTQMGFSTGVGGFSTISAATAVNKESEVYKKAAANLKAAQEDVNRVTERLAKQGQVPDEWFGKYAESADRATTAVRSVAKATEEFQRVAAPIDEDKLLKASKELWPEAAAAAEAYAKQQKAVGDAANDNIQTFEQQTKGLIYFSTQLEIAAADAEEAARAAREFRFDLEDVAYAINENDWVSAFAGLVNVLAKVDTAFKNAKTSQDKFAAAAMLAQGVGSAVGGTGGNVLAGAGSGALAGLSAASALTTLGVVSGPVGWAALGIGAVVGGLGGLLGGSSAKKKARRQAAAEAAAAEAQRQQQISDTTFSLNVSLLEAQGKAEEALAMTRQHELDALAKLSPSLVDLQKQLYAAQDAATAAAKAAEVHAKAASIQDEIDALTLSSSDLLAKTRARERAEAVALDPALGDLIDRLYGLKDAATATAKIAEVATSMVEAAEQRVDTARSALQAAYDAEKSRLQDIVSAAANAESALRSAYDAQASSIQGVIDKATSFSQSMKDFARSLVLGDESAGAGRYSVAQAEFDRIKALALSGDATAQGQFQSVAQDFLKASKDSSTSALAYQADQAKVLDATNKLATTADGQASLAQQQLAQLKTQVGALIDLGGDVKSVETAIGDLLTARGAAAIAENELKALDQQVAGLLTVNTSVLSVKDAVLGLNAAIKALADAQAVKNAGLGWTSPNGGVAVPTNPNYGNPYGDNGSFSGEIEKLMGKNAAGQATFAGFTASELAWVNSPLELGGERTAAAQAIQQLKAMYGANVLPGFAKGGSFTIGGFGGVDQNLMSINGSPAAWVGQGETVTITPPSMGRAANDDSSAALLSEVRALRIEVASLRRDRLDADLAVVKAVNRPDWADDWDVDGLPPERAE